MREDWIECIISDVSEVLNGDRGKNYPSSAHYVKSGIPFVSAGNIGKNNKLNKELNFISEDRFKLLRAGKLQKDDIVYCIRGSIGKFAIIDFCQGAIASSLCIIRTNAVIDRAYFCSYLASPLCSLEINRFDNGTAQPNLSAKDFKKFKLPIAPLPIQRAIVHKIENLFASLDKGIADLKTAHEQLRVYRQAVLKKAFEGELTPDSCTRELINLGSIIEKPNYGTSKKCSERVHGVPVLRIPNIGSGVVDTAELKYAEFEESEISKLALKEGDILIIRSNGSVNLVGKCALITKRDTRYLYAGYLIRLRPDLKRIDSKYLLYCLSSHELRIQIEKKAKSTSGVNNINSGELQSLVIPLFPLNQQYQIVREIESRLSVCDKVEQNINEALEKAEALRQSILKKAFEGKLLSEKEIAKCKQEADYEPASELLKKIKAEKK